MTVRRGAGSGDGATGADVTPDHLRALLDGTADLAAVVDLDGNVRYLNRAARRLLLSVQDAPLPFRSFDLVAPADQQRIRDEVLPALEREGRWSGNLALITASGIEVPTRSSMRRLDTNGEAPGIAWVGRDISTEKAVYERLHKKVFEDELTGLPHRSIFLDRLDMSLRRAHAEAPTVTLVFIGLDRFKEKNDRFGREIGDDLLRTVARRLQGLRSASDTVSRWGGDEFVMMCEDVTPDALQDLGARVTEAVRTPAAYGANEVFLSASVGITIAAPGSATTDELLRQVETAGQRARQRGGDSFQIYDQAMQARALRRAEVEDALRGAGDRGELLLYYQPEVSLLSERIIGAEALLRWQHPEWGLVSPNEFVPVAETSNLILEVGAWALRAGMRQCARWRELLGRQPFFLGINISARQWVQDDFVELVATTLADTGAEPSDVCLEITESALMDDLEVATETLRRLKGLGLQLAVDDFGTGYSSLSYLRRFPIDVLKVDQSFVSGLGHDPEDSAIVRAVVSMGRALGLLTVAEGVETAHQVVELRELECEVAQGYHYARPQPADELTKLLEAGADWGRMG